MQSKTDRIPKRWDDEQLGQVQLAICTRLEGIMLSVFSCPSRYTQGKNATQFLGQEMVTLGLQGPALIMAGKTAIKVLSETWRHALGNANLAFEVHAFGGECSL